MDGFVRPFRFLGFLDDRGLQVNFTSTVGLLAVVYEDHSRHSDNPLLGPRLLHPVAHLLELDCCISSLMALRDHEIDRLQHQSALLRSIRRMLLSVTRLAEAKVKASGNTGRTVY